MSAWRREWPSRITPDRNASRSIEQLAERGKNLRARIRKRERAEDTRRKILLGSFVLQRLEAEPARFAEWLALIRGELPGFLRPEDLELFHGILGGPWDGEEDCEGSLEIGDILKRLGAARRRCTYGAVAGVFGVTPAEAGPLLGERRPETSWVVSAKTGRPAGYAPDQIHPELETHPDVISGPEELRGFCRRG